MRKCFEEYILNDPGMREQSMDDIIRRLESTFKSERYKSRLIYAIISMIVFGAVHSIECDSMEQAVYRFIMTGV